MTIARSVARAVASPVSRAVGSGIGGGLTFSQVVADAVGYWPLNDNAASTTVLDNGTGGNNGTLTGAGNTSASSIAGHSGAANAALDFDGIDDHVGSIGSVSSFNFVQNTQVFAISFWLKVDALNVRKTIMGSAVSVTQRGFCVFYEYGAGIGDNAIRFFGVDASSLPTVSARTPDGAIGDTNWHHVLIQSPSTGNVIEIYVDNVLQSLTYNQNYRAVSTGNATNVLNIGRCNHTTSFLPFAGGLEKVAIWNRVLTSAERAIVST